MSNLLIERGGRAVGPFTVEEVRRYQANGHLGPQALAWTEGLLDWMPVDQVLERAASYPAASSAEFTDTAGRSIMPDEARGFSWGALLSGPVWGFPYGVWVSVLSWIPGIGVLGALWLGFNGREMAWRARAWRSAEDFVRADRGWIPIGIIVTTLYVVVFLGLTTWYYKHYVENAQEGTPPTAEQRPETPPREGADPAQRKRPGARPAEPAAKPAAPGSMRSRDQWRKQLTGMTEKQLVETLGLPATVKHLEDKNVDMWVYVRRSFERNASDPDAAMLVAVRDGVVLVVAFMKDANQ